MDSDYTIDTLNDLIKIARNGEYGFRTFSEHVKTPNLTQFFLRSADEYRQAVMDLQALVGRLGGSAEDSGTVAGAAQRGWATVKGSITGYTDLAILEETEDGEDSTLEGYRKALDGDELTGDVRLLVERQYEGVKRNHAQVRALRDQARATRT